jgi:hypothetical protein
MKETILEIHNRIVAMAALAALLLTTAHTGPIQHQTLQSPIAIVLDVTGDQGRSQQILREDDSGEAATTTTITVIQDGLMDDSIRGFKYIFKLSKKPNGNWIIKKQSKLLRCWRGRGHEAFSKEPCH